MTKGSAQAALGKFAEAVNTGNGDFVGISGGSTLMFLVVPQGYVSGAALSDNMTFNNATFASLGLTPWHLRMDGGRDQRTRTSRS